MSFSEELKSELCKIENQPCCQKAEAFGLLLFGRSFSRREMSLLTQSEAVAQRYANAITGLTGIVPSSIRSQAGKYTVKVDDAGQTHTILECLGYTGKEITSRINRANLENDCCEQAFLRGVFLVCGTVTNPEKDYHLEFVTAKQRLSLDLLRILEDVTPKIKQIRRKNGYALYIKDGEGIEDILGYMGAASSFLRMLNIRATKDVRNSVNRRMKFETANLSRTIDASVAQVNSIRTIEQLSSLDSLSEDLRELALLRLNNREASLNELGTLMHPPLSRSAVNRRFIKLSMTADELKRKQ